MCITAQISGWFIATVRYAQSRYYKVYFGENNRVFRQHTALADGHIGVLQPAGGNSKLLLSQNN